MVSEGARISKGSEGPEILVTKMEMSFPNNEEAMGPEMTLLDFDIIE